MEIVNASFVTSMTAYRPPEKDLPQIALAGRSNVGKSSLINCLCRRNRLAKVGAAPGKTRMLNFFDINGEFYLVDLPGYGYAEAGKAESARWGTMMEDYFKRCGTLKAVLHVVDIRHDPTKDDKTMNLFLRANDIPFLVVASKSDKISRGARQKYLNLIMRELQVQPWQVMCFSAESGDGRDELLDRIGTLLNG